MADATLGPAPFWVGAAAEVIRRLPAGRYRAMNFLSRRATRPFWATLPKDLGRLRFRCDLRDALMREACFTGRYEPQETAILQRILRAGMTFVDVGANWGYFTLVGGYLVGPTGRVVCIEADPRACRTVRSNLAENHLDAVALVNVAAADTPGTISVREYDVAAGETGNFGVGQAVTGGGRRLDIAARPLDDVLDDSGVEHVDLLKMDIEGSEARALAGLDRRLAARHVDRILLEIHPHFLRELGSSAEHVIALLRTRGYQGWRIDHSPEAHRRTVSAHVNVSSILVPLEDGVPLGIWPHVLWIRSGLSPTI